jgi:tetratricopeptide (TPR) repeat protein
VRISEEATARFVAETSLWLARTEPAQVPLVDMTVVVDRASPSLLAWEPLLAEFLRLLQQLGLADVRPQYLDCQPDRDGRLRSVLRGPGASALPGGPARLLDPSGNRVILLFTDGLGQSWRSGLAQQALLIWGRSGPVAVVHQIPRSRWHQTLAATRPVRLRSPRAMAPNAALRVARPQRWEDPFAPPGRHAAMPIPVLSLDGRSLRRWANLVMGDGGQWLDAPVLAVTDPPEEPPRTDVPEPRGDTVSLEGGPDGLDPIGSAQDKVMRFRGDASPQAYRLATQLAAAPLDPGFIRWASRLLVPDAQVGHLAEVLLSGLVRPADQPASGQAAASVPLEFVDGARDALLAAQSRAETARVLHIVSEYYAGRVPAASSLIAALATPDTIPDSPVNAQTLPLVRAELAVMRALSGPYAGRAGRLGRRLASFQESFSADDAGESTIPVARNDMTTLTRASQPLDINDHRDTVGATMSNATTQTSPGSDTRIDRPDIEAAARESVRIPASQGDERSRPGGSMSSDTAVTDTTTVPSPLRDDHRRLAPVPRVWGNVPPVNPNFTGREELLTEVRNQLREGTTAAVLPHALHGMGGVGKSQLAVEYVYRHSADYDVVWWIPSEQPTQILAALVDLARQLNLQAGTEANTAVPAVREALRTGVPYSNWLLIFDNAENVEAVRPYLPTGGPGKIIITSRNREWDRVARTLTVDIFRREESKQLLCRRNPDLSDEDADRLAEALGDLPLAIEQAASWRAATGMATDEYLGLIENKQTELLNVEPPPDYPVSVGAAWNVSLDQLERRNPAALQLLQVCAFFAPEPISRDLFTGARSSIAPELDEALRDPIKFGRAVRDLNRYALAKIEHRHNTIQLHRLVQAVIIDRMSPRLAADMRHGAHLLLADANPNYPNATELWGRYQALLPHVEASETIECDNSSVRQLVLGIMSFRYFWGDHEGARDLARTVRKLWEQRLGESDAQTLAAAKWLAFILRLLGEYQEALEISEHTVDVYRRTAADDDEGALDAMTQLSGSLRVKGDFAAARDLDRTVVARCRHSFGEDDPVTLSAAHSLGVSLRLAGDYAEALKLDEDTWQRRAIVLGESHESTLNTLNGLAIDRRETGDYRGARAMQEQTYTRYLEWFGADNPATVRAARNLAVCRRRAGDHAGAFVLAQETLGKFRRRYGDVYPDTLASAANFSVELRNAGDIAESLALGERTITQYRAKLGALHAYTLSAQINLAVTLRLSGEAARALEIDRAAVEQLRASLGADHAVALVGAVNLASDHYAMGDYETAMEQGRGTLDRLQATLGDDHPTTLACAANLALDLRAKGLVSDADRLRNETLARYRAVLGDAHPATSTAMRNIRCDCDLAPIPL